MFNLGPAGDCLQFGAGLIDGHAGFQPANRVSPPIATPHRSGQHLFAPYFRAFGKVEPRRHDADDRQRRPPSERERLANDSGVAAKLPLPQRVAQNHLRAPILFLASFLGKETATELGAHAEQVKEHGRDAGPSQAFRVARAFHEPVARAVQGERLKAAALLAPVEKAAPQDVEALVSFGRIALPEPDDPLRILERKRSQQQALEHAEHADGHADAQRQGPDRDHCEPGTPAQGPPRLSHITQHRLRSTSPRGSIKGATTPPNKLSLDP